LKQAKVGVPVAELIRQTEITEQRYYRWKAKDAGLEVAQVRQIKQLREENMKLSELDNLRVPSKHTIAVSQFIDQSELNPEYVERPYFVVPSEVC
jgi:hypothetical protein